MPFLNGYIADFIKSTMPTTTPTTAPTTFMTDETSSDPTIPIDCVSETDGSEVLRFDFDLTVPENDVHQASWNVINIVDGSEWSWSGSRAYAVGSSNDVNLRLSVCLPKNQCYKMNFLMESNVGAFTAYVAGEQILSEESSGSVSHEM